MTLDDLRTLLTAGEFDHATYRDFGTIWEGLWIYKRDSNGFRGYTPAGMFPKGSPDLEAAHALVRRDGVSIGAYGNG